ncbi:MAG TPA: class I SAM-dependent methyltransferase [Candidatus Acidoferrum sp.]|nr:class I SAM-dependent methyltransferase [Candidatus Acidoferrum sp.]
MKLGETLLEQNFVYRLWQAPFASTKLAPVLAHNNLRQVRRVLDVGCGPGTNTHLFAHADYLGIDINPDYIAHARKTFQRSFVLADVTTYEMPPDQRYDFILLNSFLHHIGDSAVRRILSHMRTLLTPDGYIHILDLVLPVRPSIALLVARLDRGDYPRSLTEWRLLFAENFDLVVFEPFPLKALGATLWNMVYCKGKAKP